MLHHHKPLRARISPVALRGQKAAAIILMTLPVTGRHEMMDTPHCRISSGFGKPPSGLLAGGVIRRLTCI
jgi:hypothetical protein